jgi:glucose-1-phosphate thymidylyltransferase
MRVFGVIPAAGKGTRLAPLPFSKELFPLGFIKSQDKYYVRPVSHYLLETFKKAEIKDIFWITSEDKSDIQKYYKSGTSYQMNFCYLNQDEPKGMVDAITCIDPWLRTEEDYLIALGMPDTLFYPEDMFIQMKDLLLSPTHFDVVLGIFHTEQWGKLGMVEFKEENGLHIVSKITDKPKIKPQTDFAWGTAIWRSSFQNILQKVLPRGKADKEYTLSEAFNYAIDHGLKVGAIKGSKYMDIGTIEDLQKTITLTNDVEGYDEH